MAETKESSEKKAVKPKKASTTKAAAKPKAAPKKEAAAKKVAAPKKAAAKPAAKKTKAGMTPEHRYRMIEVAAYYLAEKDGFAGSPVEYWIAAELQIGK
mgnify:CR=1 FL=1